MLEFAPAEPENEAAAKANSTFMGEGVEARRFKVYKSPSQVKSRQSESIK